jgi:hypothetical protein
MEDFENEFFDDKPKAPNNRKRLGAIISLAAVLGLGLGGAIALLNGTITADVLTPQASVTSTCCSCPSPTPTRTKSPVYNKSVTPSGAPSAVSSYTSPTGAPSTISGPSSVAVTPESGPSSVYPAE